MPGVAQGAFPGPAAARLGTSADYQLSRRLFIAVLGAVFLIAFGSLWPQLGGLIGARGISPASELLPWIRQQLGWKAYFKVPTLCWFSFADGFMRGVCALGMALSVLLILGVAPRWVLLALWMLYLSLVSVEIGRAHV